MDEPTRPGPKNDEDDRPGTAPSALGLVEVTISGLGTGQVRSSAISAATVEELDRLRAMRDAAEGRKAHVGASAADPGASFAVSRPSNSDETGNGSIQLELVSTGSFTDGDRQSGGYRYIYATYRVRNAQQNGIPYDTPRRNLTFYAVDTESTIGSSAISKLEHFDGSNADAALAAQVIPTGAVARNLAGEIVSLGPDVLQVITEGEAAQLLENVAPTGIRDVFPYGFVVRNPNDPYSRTLPANPAEDRFDGVVTFAYKVPLQANPADDPFTVSILFLAVDDDVVRITQSREERTPVAAAAFEARAASLGADVLTILGPGGVVGAVDLSSLRILCDVRVAGTAGAGAVTIGDAPGVGPWLATPLADPAHAILATTRFHIASCANIPTVNKTTFAIHGFQSGRNAVDPYQGVGTQIVRAPTPPNGSFFPGEEVEVTLTTTLGFLKPIVARYRVATSPAPARFESISGQAQLDGDPRHVSVGDLNGDGKLDLVVHHSYYAGVFLNPGNGTLGSVTRYNAGYYTNIGALGDLDGDGHLDIVATRDTRDNIAVFFNNGDGTFAGPTFVPAPDSATSIALGDLDGDGDLDLVAAFRTDKLLVALNHGNGTFASPSIHSVGRGSKKLVLADLDGDGDLDVAVAKQQSNDVSVLINRGDGTFEDHRVYGTGQRPTDVVAVDMDGDGHLDLVTANNDGGSVSILRNRGDGTFHAARNYPIAAGSPYSLAAGDLDGDGDVDLAVGLLYSKTVVILLNLGNGSFDVRTHTSGGSVRDIALGDMDGDGDLDVITTNTFVYEGAPEVSILRNN
jgi:hypothetical protein